MRCPACGGETRAWLTAAAGEPSDTQLYELARCRECGTAVTLGGPPSRHAYEIGIYSGVQVRLGPLVRALQRHALRLPLKLLRRAGLARGGSVLDAGAGRGRLVAALRAEGYRAEGIDPSPRGPGVAAKAIDEHTASGLDAVVLWHVLEHVEDPAATARRVHAWLGPGGLALFAVPNLASLQARIAGPDWFHLDLPRHRTQFTVAGLRELLTRSGFEVVAEWHFVTEYNPLGMWLAFLTRLGMTPGLPFHLFKRSTSPTARDALVLFVAGPVLLVPAVLLELVAGAVRRGGSVALVARRQAEA